MPILDYQIPSPLFQPFMSQPQPKAFPSGFFRGGERLSLKPWPIVLESDQHLACIHGHTKSDLPSTRERLDRVSEKIVEDLLEMFGNPLRPEEIIFSRVGFCEGDLACFEQGFTAFPEIPAERDDIIHLMHQVALGMKVA